jgi:CheY-like chemotaxis protein
MSMQKRRTTPSLRALLAEDDELVRSALTDLLSKEGFEVFEAASGLAALEAVQRVRFSFSVMDIDMPGMSGIEVLKAIRQQFGVLPSIMITGNDSRERQVEAMAAGAFALLAKPVVPDLLRFSVKRLLDHHYRR